MFFGSMFCATSFVVCACCSGLSNVLLVRVMSGLFLVGMLVVECSRFMSADCSVDSASALSSSCSSVSGLFGRPVVSFLIFLISCSSIVSCSALCVGNRCVSVVCFMFVVLVILANVMFGLCMVYSFVVVVRIVL